VHIALVRSRAPDRAGTADDPLAEALAARGVEVSRPCWDDPEVDWERADLALVRTTWDYAERREEFLAWVEGVGALVEVLNPPQVLRWNTHKSYLLELEERGAPVVPTAWLGRGDRVEVAEVLQARGWRRAVAKPAIGVGGRGLVRVDAGRPQASAEDVRTLLDTGDVLVQPYLDTVEVGGELSVVVADGEVTHAVRKRPRPGEYRVQQERGATYERVEVDADTAALARWVVEATGHQLLLARVDLIEDEVGALQLVELEATEPDLYLHLASDGVERIADAVLRRVAATDGADEEEQ
jgi:glutathione synthase/RimK-type ligase-like ATP-grasp enzyme